MTRTPDPFVTFIEDLFRDLGTIQCKSMFGGYGVYFRGRMFALIADDRLYMKTDASLAQEYEEQGSEPFIIRGDRKPIQMSYWSLPEDALEQPELAIQWANKSLAAAVRAAKKSGGVAGKRGKKKNSKGSGVRTGKATAEKAVKSPGKNTASSSAIAKAKRGAGKQAGRGAKKKGSATPPGKRKAEGKKSTALSKTGGKKRIAEKKKRSPTKPQGKR